MCVIVGTVGEPSAEIKREYKCKGGKCNVTVSFIVKHTEIVDIVHEAAIDAEQIRSIRDRLGSSVDYLEGVMGLGEFISEVSLGWTEKLINSLSFYFRSSIPP